MGEYADLFINHMFDEHEHGGLSAYGRDYPTSIRCKFCGQGPFDWFNFGTWSYPMWRLADDGKLHVCPPPKPEDLFEDIS